MPGAVIVSRPAPSVTVIVVNRPAVRNCVDGPTARLLHDAFIAFETDDEARVAVLTGSGGYFCAGADLSAMIDGGDRKNDLDPDLDKPGPMGPTRLALTKPVIAAIEGPCVAGGLELAAWTDLRVASTTASFGVLCRLRGVPLIDGGTVRLPRLIGESHASDLILTGRVVDAQDAKSMGLVNSLTGPGEALNAAIELAKTIAGHPQECMRNDRLSMLGMDLGPRPSGNFNVVGAEREAMRREFELGMRSLQSDEFRSAVKEFLGKPKNKL